MVFREILNQICAPIKMIEHNHYFFFYLKFKALCFWQKRLKGIEFYFTFLHKFKRRKKLKQKSFSSPGDFFRMVLNKNFIFLMQFLYRSSSRWFFFPIFRFMFPRRGHIQYLILTKKTKRKHKLLISNITYVVLIK